MADSRDFLRTVIAIVCLTIGIAFAPTKNEQTCLNLLYATFPKDKLGSEPYMYVRHVVGHLRYDDLPGQLIEEYVNDLKSHMTEGNMLSPEEFCNGNSICETHLSGFGGEEMDLKSKSNALTYAFEKKTLDDLIGWEKGSDAYEYLKHIYETCNADTNASDPVKYCNYRFGNDTDNDYREVLYKFYKDNMAESSNAME